MSVLRSLPRETAVVALWRCTCLVGISVLLWSGCRKDVEPTAWGVATQVAPFASLRGIVLPTPLRDVAAKRPTAIYLEYGLRESVDRAEIEYHGERENYHAPVRPRDPVTHVTVTWEFSADDSATVLWNRLRGEITEQAGGQPQCARFNTPRYPVRMARWQIGEGTIYLRQKYGDSVTTSELETMRSSLVMGVAVDSAARSLAAVKGLPGGCE